MVKNLNTIDRSERIRIGKHVPDEQAVNTIIINASSDVIQAPQGGLYVSPIRTNESIASNTLCYDITTKEIVDSGKTIDLQGVTQTGNVTSETLQFTNNTTAFVTTSNVGISNVNPNHELSVGGDVYIEGNLTVIGQTTAISSENLRVKDAIIELGENNTDGDFIFDLGLVMTRPGSNVTASYIESSNEYIIGYTQNSASDTYITPDTSNLIQMRVYGDVTANSFVGDGSLLTNVVQYTDLTANLTVIRNEMAANTLSLRDDLQSNATILRDEMSANTITIRGEMASNTLTLRDDLQSNASILRDEMSANTVTLRGDLQSNLTIIRGEMAANTLSLRSDLQSNVTEVKNTLRGEMAANTITLRGEMAANTVTLRGEMAANTVTLRGDLQSNANILRSEMAANTVTLLNEIALKSNIESPVFTGIITGDGGGISNISLQHVTEYGDSTDRTITMSNTLSMVTSGNVGVNTPTPQRMLHVAGDILADDDIIGVDFYGDDATFTGGLTVSKDTLIYGNLEVRGNTTYLSTQNLLVEDPILALGANNTSSSLDTGLIVLVYQGDSNVAFGYRGASNEFIISHTLSSPDDSELIPDTSNVINVHVYGDVTADSFVGDGGLLSNIASNLHQIALNGNTTSETIILDGGVTGLSVTNNVLVGGNVTALSFAGDGGLLSNIASNLQQIALNGNVTTETLYFQQEITGIDVSNNVLVGGNVTASNFIGDGGLLSNIASNLQQIALNGNVTTETLYLNNPVTGLEVLSNVLVGGNVTADVFRGDGGLLSNIAATLQEVSDNGNVTSNTLQFTNPTTAFVTNLTSNVGVNIAQLNDVTLATPINEDILVYDGTNWVNQKQNHLFLNARADGQNILKGEVVCATGTTGNNTFNVVRADARDPTKMPAIGIAYQNINSGDSGLIVTFGRADGIAAPNFIEGETVYVSNTVPGGLSNVVPHGEINGVPNLIQNVGLVVKSHQTQGIVSVTGVGRTNAIPNANVITQTPAYVYTDGNTNTNTLHKIDPVNLLTKLQTLEQVVNTGNTVSNSIEITGNLVVSQNVNIGGISVNHFPIVGTDGYLKASTISIANGSTVIASDLQVTGDIIATGNSYVIESNSVVIEDRVFGIANNNVSHTLDVGIIMGHPGKNIGLIHHGEDGDPHEHEFTIGYTQNTVTDNSITDDTSNAITVRVLGNLITQNNLTVDSGGSYFGDGTTLTGVALETDLASNASRVSVLETDLASNASRVGVLETDLASNVSRISVLEQRDLDDIVNIGNSTSNTILLTNTDVGLVATGNIQANYFIGDGSNLTGIATTLQSVSDFGNTTSNTIQFTNTDTSLITLGSVGIANTNPTCDLAIGSNVCFDDTSSNILTIDGNILAHRITLDSIQIASIYALEYVTQTGNTTSNTIEFTNESTGLVTSANVGVANANPIHTLDVGSNLWVDDVGSNVLYVDGNVYVAGAQLTTDGKVGISNTNPQHDLSVASNLYVEDAGSNVLVVNGNASIGTTLTLGAIEITSAYTLEEVTGQGNVTSNTILLTNTDVGLVATGNIQANYFIGDGSNLTGIATTLQSVSDFGNTTSNTIQFTNVDLGAAYTGGIIVNTDSYACKHYAYSNVSVPTNFANVAMTFASNVFHAKITAQLTHGNEEVSTMILDVQGGTRNGTTSSLNIASGPGSVFGHNNTKPWSMSVGTTPTKVILEPSSAGTSVYGVDVYIEYKSSSTEGKLESINIGADTVKSFVY